MPDRIDEIKNRTINFSPEEPAAYPDAHGVDSHDERPRGIWAYGPFRLLCSIRGKLVAIILLVVLISIVLSAIHIRGVYLSMRQVAVIEEELVHIHDIVNVRLMINMQMNNFISCLMADNEKHMEKFLTADSMIRSRIEKLIEDSRTSVIADEHVMRLDMSRTISKSYEILFRTFQRAIDQKKQNNIKTSYLIAEYEVEAFADKELFYYLNKAMQQHITHISIAYMKLVRELPSLPWYLRESLRYERSVGHAIDYFKSVSGTEVLVHDQMKSLREYLFGGVKDELHEYYEKTGKVEVSFRHWIDIVEVQMMAGMPGEDHDLDLILKMRDSYMTSLKMADEAIKLRMAGRVDEAYEYLHETFDPYMDDNIYSAINLAIMDGTGEVADARRSLYRLAKVSAMQSFGILLLLSSAIITVLAKMANGMIASLDRLKAATAEIGSGRLDYRIKVRGGDELAQLAAFINEMADNLSDVTISRDYMENMLNSMHDSLIVMDRDCTVVSSNPAACRMLHYESGELDGSGAERFCMQADVINRFAASLGRGEGMVNVRMDYIRKDGSTVPVLCSITSSMPPGGEGGGIIILAMDITEHVESARRLMIAKDEWQKTLDSIEDAIVLLDRDRRIIRSNKALAKYAGVNVKNTRGMLCHEVIDYCSSDYEGCPHQQLMEDGMSHTAEIRDPDTGRIYLVSVSPYYDDHGALQGSVHVTRDITESKMIEEDVLRNREHLAELVKERTEDLRQVNEKLADEMNQRRRLEREMLDREDNERRMIGNDLHDGLGQLLTGVSFKAMSLERKLKKLDMKEADEAENIKGLIDLAKLDVKRLSKGLTSLGLGEGGLKVALEELVQTMGRIFNVKCNLFYEEYVEIEDATTAYNMYRIAQEAATNAVKHSKSDVIDLKLSTASGKIILTISDNGMGLPLNVQETTGLGLKIMRHRAELIGAELVIDSSGDSGTMVSCILSRP